ncbi:MAG: phosphate ABC transporter substrate-binding protein PstS, partial [Patescibacteria group bacterium]|nr:phosphate ABC transporter substrate-binding protein PstS [Patescibacteria group bacterium]
IPGIPTGMNLTGNVIANIYLGKISAWNDPGIQTLNPGFKLPNQPITVVHRSDGSGTTYVFTDYLTRISPDWSTFVGKGKSVSWPTGVGAPQNIGVADTILNNTYAIGYVELAYVLQHHMTYAKIQNGRGTAFIAPSEESISNAVKEYLETLPTSDGDWSQISLVNTQGNDSYPISSMTYLLVHQDLGKIPGMTKDKAQTIIHLIYWMVNDGQAYAPSLQYVPLPMDIIEKDDEGLSKVVYNGQSLFNYAETPEFGQFVPLTFIVATISIILITFKIRLAKLQI